MATTASVKDLTEAVKKLTGAFGKDDKVNRDLTLGIGALYKGVDALKQASDMQVAVLRLNGDVSRSLNTSLAKSAPATANLAASMQLLEAGLEDNSEGLGEFVVRAQLLGENIQAITTGLRSLTLTLGLSRSEQTMLADSIEDSAKTYRTSTESVVAGLAKFGETLAILNRTQTGQTNDLVTQMVAMTERFAPGALAGILEPLVGSGAESLARAAMLGVQGDVASLMGPNAQVSDIERILDNITRSVDRIVGSGQQAIVGADIFRQITGMSLATANSAASLKEIIQNNKDAIKQQAKVNDALTTINSLLEEIKTPITETLVAVAGKLQELKEGADQEAVTRAARSLGDAALLSGIFATGRLLLGIVGPWGLAIAGIYSALQYLGVLGDFSLASLIGIEKDTKTVAATAEEESDKGAVNLAEQYNRRHSELLSQAIRQSGRDQYESMMTSKNAEIQRQKQIQLFGNMISEIRNQTLELREKRSPFANGSNSGDGGK